MPRECIITGRRKTFGNNVSHAKNHTRRSFSPNLQHSRLYSEVLGRHYRLRVSTQGLRTLDKAGGFDAWLTKTPNRNLSTALVRVKNQVIERSGTATSQE
ncbi:MAG: 50S ribosomal protein L28 [Alphaproteobacteria bacterium]|nr:50S ribosomal protein L28 [Alphaproteobacteria bacterium]